jgi:hypothetical protein
MPCTESEVFGHLLSYSLLKHVHAFPQYAIVRCINYSKQIFEYHNYFSTSHGPGVTGGGNYELWDRNVVLGMSVENQKNTYLLILVHENS